MSATGLRLCRKQVPESNSAYLMKESIVPAGNIFRFLADLEQ